MEEIKLVTDAKGEFAQFFALDDCSALTPVADFKRNKVAFARSMSAMPLEGGKFGPSFPILPKDEHTKELNTPTAVAKLVWQVSGPVFR